jgi:hypothetical protein
MLTPVLLGLHTCTGGASHPSDVGRFGKGKLVPTHVTQFYSSSRILDPHIFKYIF